MKALTLYQPSAALVASGAKRIETRSWGTSYRGPLAIHAGKRIPPEYRSLWLQEPFLSALVQAGVVTVGPGDVLAGATSYQLHEERYHLGCVIATCELVGVDRFGEWSDRKPMIWAKGHQYFELTEQERAFGNFSVGRYGWFLANVKPLAVPVPARGYQGLWEWEIRDELE